MGLASGLHLISLGGEAGNAQAVVDNEVADHASLFEWHCVRQNRRIPIPVKAMLSNEDEIWPLHLH